MISEVYNMDCVEGMKRYPDNHFDLAVVDPPYGINLNTEFKIVNTDRPNSYNLPAKHKQKEWDKDKPPKEYWQELYRVSKNQIVFGANHFVEYLKSSKGWVFWDKLNGDISIFSHGEIIYTSFETKIEKISMRAARGANNRNDRIHPTQKPVALYDWIFNNYAKEGDLILDTHLGSGSSRIAAHKAGLDFIAFELDKEYCDAQGRRYKEFASQLTIFA